MWCFWRCVSERSGVKRCNVVLLLVCFREKWYNVVFWRCVSERSGVKRCNVVLLLVCFREKWCNAV